MSSGDFCNTAIHHWLLVKPTNCACQVVGLQIWLFRLLKNSLMFTISYLWFYCIVDEGCLTQLFTGPNPMKGRNAFDDFGFSKELQKTRMKLFPLNLLHELSVFADCRRTKLTENVMFKIDILSDFHSILSTAYWLHGIPILPHLSKLPHKTHMLT